MPGSTKRQRKCLIFRFIFIQYTLCASGPLCLDAKNSALTSSVEASFQAQLFVMPESGDIYL
jgi:hypothetical protein